MDILTELFEKRIIKYSACVISKLLSEETLLRKNPFFNHEVIVQTSLIALDSGDTGESLTLNGFEQCTTSGRHIAHLIGHTEFVNAGH